MSEKSELSYLLEALRADEAPPHNAAAWMSNMLSRAIERRKQDLAKADAALLYTNREKLYMDTPQNVPNTADNTPKGRGDETMCWRCSTQYNRSDKACPECEAANANANPDLAMWQQGHDYDALLAERDALRAHDSQCIKDRVAYCEEIEELEAVVERLTAERDAARAELEIVREQYASYRECAGASIGANLDEKLLEQLSRSEARIAQANSLLRQALDGGIVLHTLRRDIDAFLARVGKQPSGEE